MRVVLGFSGGLDTCVSLKLLQERYDADVITVTVDVGQRSKLFKSAERRARQLGAVKHVYVNAKQEFVREYVFRSIKANGCYEGYPLSIALARYPTASWLVKVALRERADAIAHGCTGKGNDQFRFDMTISTLAPHLRLIAPVREFDLTREWEVTYAKKYGIEIERRPYSIDENLWGRSIEGSVLEDPSRPPPEDVFELTRDPSKSPRKPLLISLKFERGIPVALDGKRMDGVTLIEKLNEMAGKYGIGRIDIIEDRILGLKAREVYEAPAATVLLEAHEALEALVLTKEELGLKSRVDRKWSELVYHGRWFDPLRDNLEAFIDSTQKRVNGEVEMRFIPGKAEVIGRKSPSSLYDEKIVSFHRKSFDQKAVASVTKFHGMNGKIFRLRGDVV